MCFILASLYTWHSTTGSEIDVCVMAREDEVENEQEVAQPTEADATEATVDEEDVEEVVEDADDGKVKLRCYHTSEALDLN